MRVVIGALIIAGVLLGLFATSPLGIVYAGLIYLGLPVGLAVALVLIRRYPPSKAAVAGAVVAVGTLVLILLPAIVVSFLLGNLASDDDCDGFCTSNTGGLFLALFFLPVSAVPLAIAGGVMSAGASFVGVRTANDA